MNYSDDLINLTFDIMRLIRRKMVCTPTVKGKDSMNFLQFHGLGIIAEHEGITMKELSLFMKVSAPTSTSFVNRLVKAQWIERFPDIHNRKLVKLRLTEMGKMKLHQQMEEKHSCLRAIVSHLSEQDQKDLARIYRNLLTSLSRSAHS